MSDKEILEKLKQLPEEKKKKLEDLLDELLDKKNDLDEEKKHFPLFGAFKGKIRMSKDFDEPLEYLKDYL